MTVDELEYIAERTAEILYWKMQEPPVLWISQNKAWESYGGRALVTKLIKEGKVRVRKNANRVECYVQDLAQYSKPIGYIKQCLANN